MILQDLLTWEPMGEDDFYSRCLNSLLESVEEISSEAVMIKMDLLPQGLMKVHSVEEMPLSKLLEEERHPYYLLLHKEKRLLRIHFNGPTYMEWVKYKPWTGKELKALTLPTRGRIMKTKITVQKQHLLKVSPDSAGKNTDKRD